MAKKAHRDPIFCDNCGKQIKTKRFPKTLKSVKGRDLLLYFCNNKCKIEYDIK